MARIPDGVIERLKATVSVQRLAEARGVVLTKHGADLHGRCPFHEDRTPSLVITPTKNLWHCLGACQTGGTAIDWVMHAEGVSFRHAVELLQNDALPLAAASSSSPTPPPKQSTVKKLAMPLEREADDARLLGQVIEYYHQTLLQNPEALEYLQRRGIGHEEAIRTFRLGVADRTLGYRLPEKTRVEGAAMRGTLQRIGILRESGHEHFNGSLVIPIIDGNGEVTEVYGRKLNDHLRPGTPKHLYLPGPHRGVWNAAALGTSKEVILCEALIDALTFWCAGYRNVTASYGVEGFTADHSSVFKQHRIERVLIAYDRDEAGEKAAQKLADQLMTEGIDCYRILFPKGLDANEYALKVGPAAKSLGVAIRSAQWLGQGKAKPLTAAAVASTSVAAESSTVDPSLAAEEAAKGKTSTDPEASNTETLLDVPMAQPLQPPLPARALPEPPAVLPPPASQALGVEHEHHFTFGERRYRVRGLEKNLSLQTLKINLLVSQDDQVHVDTLDLYAARARGGFITQAAIELRLKEELIKADLGRVLLQCEALQEQALRAALEVKPAAVVVGETEREAALDLLKSPDLLARIAGDFSRCGIVGERSNALVGYLAAISRKLDRPLALLIQSTSAAGKSSLLDAVLRFVPEEDRVVYSAMTGQSLFYMGEMNLKHKLLAIAEEEGAHRASYALKLLQSEGELTIASTSKDPATGKLVTEAYHVEGPVMIALTTTAAEIDEELLNRCLVLSVDEGRQQTQAIHAAQRARRTLAGLQSRAERETLLRLHQNAQRLLEPLAVVNPYADRLTFLDDRTRTRRDHEKYLTLIDTIALLHQHQREVKTLPHGEQALRYIEVTLGDIALANELAHEVLGRTLDELPPQTRRLLGLVVKMVADHCRAQHIRRADYRFSRRAVREYTRWGDTQLKIHLSRLTELEYLLVHRGGRGQSFEYELLFDGETDTDAPHASGLIDTDTLTRDYDAERSGGCAPQSQSGRPSVGTLSGDSQSITPLAHPEKASASSESPTCEPKTLSPGSPRKTSSYLSPPTAEMANA
jgi:DNA primase catalytic core